MPDKKDLYKQQIVENLTKDFLLNISNERDILLKKMYHQKIPSSYVKFLSSRVLIDALLFLLGTTKEISKKESDELIDYCIKEAYENYEEIMEKWIRRV